MGTHPEINGAAPRPSGLAAKQPGMAERVAAYDWSTAPPGPMDLWPEPLKAAVQIILSSASRCSSGGAPS